MGDNVRTGVISAGCLSASEDRNGSRIHPETPMNNNVIHTVFSILNEEMTCFKDPIVTRIAQDNDPFAILISTMLSLRTKDTTTEHAFNSLVSVAATPYTISRLPTARLEELIYPVGFYKTKAKNIRLTSSIIADKYSGRVPDEIDELIALPGVGRKTANLVVTLGFKKMGICVDTHVHRITNRWGYVRTKDPLGTEMRLREILPKKYWLQINDLLVAYGQNICRPIGPFCSRCRLATYCEQMDVKKPR